MESTAYAFKHTLLSTFEPEQTVYTYALFEESVKKYPLGLLWSSCQRILPSNTFES